jgi:IS30 family transposase
MGPRDCLTQSRRLGDWEVDTIIDEACEQVIASPTEHESCPTLPSRVECRILQPVGDTTGNMLQSLGALAQAMTCDGGNRPAPYQRIARSLETRSYAAHLYATQGWAATRSMEGPRR